MILPPTSEISHHHMDVTNITVISWRSFMHIDVIDQVKIHENLFRLHPNTEHSIIKQLNDSLGVRSSY